MKKLIFKSINYLIIALLLFGCKNNSVESNFKKAVTDYWTAIMEKNWDKAISYSFQTKIETLGGFEKAKAFFQESMKPLKITSFSIDKTQLMHDTGNVYLAVANVTFEAERTNEINGIYKIKSETGVIGHTDNAGDTWHFIGVTNEERNGLGALMPDIFQKLNIPQEHLFVYENGKWESLDLNNMNENASIKKNHAYFCNYSKVSNLFDFNLIVDKMKDKDSEDVSQAYLKIITKDKKETIQTIEFIPESSMMSYECSSRSYITGFNKNEEAMDGMYGDLVVADFNFDGKEDFAIARDIGFTEFYNFYLQQNNHFEISDFLTTNLRGFPSLDTINKTLTTSNATGVDGLETQVFQFVPEKSTYILIRNEVRNVNTGKLK